MPIRNLGPCACCQLAAYPTKAVVTAFAGTTFVGELERKGDTTLVYAYANPMRIEYVVHFSDGSTVNRTFKASKDFDTDSANVDTNWSVDMSTWIIEYRYVATETDTTGAGKYQTEIVGRWDGHGYMYLTGVGFGCPTEAGNSIYGTLEFAFERVEE